jgi:hypothetical protein
MIIKTLLIYVNKRLSGRCHQVSGQLLVLVPLFGTVQGLNAIRDETVYIEGYVKASTWHYSGVPESRVSRLDLSQKTGM